MLNMKAHSKLMQLCDSEKVKRICKKLSEIWGEEGAAISECYITLQVMQHAVLEEAPQLMRFITIMGLEELLCSATLDTQDPAPPEGH